MKITVHTLVKNEENFIWYALNSVLDFVDEILVWDMDSKDNTEKIIKTIDSSKIKYRKIADLGIPQIASYRQEMIKITKADWIFILDGDEVWRQKTISNFRNEVSKNSSKYEVMVVPNYMLIGDMYHFQEEKAGKYRIANKLGHFNVRAFQASIKGLHVKGVYPDEAFTNENNIKVQDFPQEKIIFLKDKYLHASFLKRSSQSLRKLKYEIGEEFPKDFYYPEVFFKKRPDIVPNVWSNPRFGYKLRALIETPLKKIKRRLA